MFCKVCKKRGGHYVYVKEGSKNLEVSAFQKNCWALQSGDRVLEKVIKQGLCACDESLASLFRTL